MMNRVSAWAPGLLLASLSLSACISDDKIEPVKGEVDEDSPPTDPTALTEPGKEDGATQVLAYSKESAHPYANNANLTFALDLASTVPPCTSQVKLHFSVLRTEAGYDFVSVRNGSGTEVQRFDGTKDNTWTNWIPLSSAKTMSIKLTSDASVVKDGFKIDQVEWQGSTVCPAGPQYLCTMTSIDLRRPAPACGCMELSHCTPFSTIKISHTVGGGFTGQITGKKLIGNDLSTTVITTAGGETLTPVGTIDNAALTDFLRSIATTSVLYGPGRQESANWTECFNVTTDQETVSYCAAQGSHTPAIVDAITKFEALASCGSGGALTCGSGLSCDANHACTQSQGCICPAIYQPQCGVNGTTYSNACAAGCAGVEVKHAGECGVTGDSCGTIRGLVCQDSYKCWYGATGQTPPFPDAGGSCTAANYCASNATAQMDCAGLIHPAVLGQWTCPNNVCTYQAGPPWNDVAGFSFETTHPYASNAAQWQQLYLPAGATKMRLQTVGTFDLEANYDFLEVWSWVNNAWVRTKRYTGTAGPTSADVFDGGFFYLKFVSDPSVTKAGFKVTAQSM